MNEVSIIINGVRYDAVEIPTDFPYHPCAYCGVMEYCTSQGNTTFCDIFELGDKWFKKSDKKFEQKKYVFNNYFSSESYKRIEVEAETILEAKKKVKEMGYDNMRFLRINIL